MAIIRFTSRVNQLNFFGLSVLGSDVSRIKTLNIEDCKYRLTVTSLWQVPGPAQINVLAKIEIAGLVDQGDGRYTGNAAVQWEVIAGQVGDCQGTIPPESQAQVVGQVLDDDMNLDVTYDTATVGIVVNCQGVGGVQNVSLTPAHLTLVSIATAGGATRVPQILAGPGNDPGEAVLILQPVSSQ